MSVDRWNLRSGLWRAKCGTKRLVWFFVSRDRRPADPTPSGQALAAGHRRASPGSAAVAGTKTGHLHPSVDVDSPSAPGRECCSQDRHRNRGCYFGRVTASLDRAPGDGGRRARWSHYDEGPARSRAGPGRLRELRRPWSAGRRARASGAAAGSCRGSGPPPFRPASSWARGWRCWGRAA